MNILTLVAKPDIDVLTSSRIDTLLQLCGGTSVAWLKEGIACDIHGIQHMDGLKERITQYIGDTPIDWCLQGAASRTKKLLICDMDSTIIQQECIDEIADVHGIGAEVSDITERAMRGELDFTESLTARVGLLRGLDESALESVWNERIRLTPGAETLVRTMGKIGAHTMLVSGGFTFFTSKVANAVGFHEHHANTLSITEHTLTGDVTMPVLDKDAKKRLLLERCDTLGITPQDSVAIGDGANDAEMVRTAGLGVAFYAKPFLCAQANATIKYTDLTCSLYFQGISQSNHA